MNFRAILNNYESGDVGRFLYDLSTKGIECPASYAGQLMAAIRTHHGDITRIAEILPDRCGFIQGLYCSGPVAVIRSYSLLDAIQPSRTKDPLK